MTLPFKRMHSLCKDDKLHVKHEGQLLRLVDRYLEVRENNESLPKLEEETDAISGAKKNWDELVQKGVLTETEGEAKKKAEEEAAAKAKEEEAKQKEEEEKKDADAHDDLWKANRPLHRWNEKERTACTDRLKMSRLKKQEKQDLYGCVRFVHMGHEELVALSSDAKYAVASEYITEALSYKLNRYENALKQDLKYNNKNYRVNFEPTPEERALQEQAAGNSFMNQSQVSGYGAPSAPGTAAGGVGGNPILAALSNAVKGAAAQRQGMNQTMPNAQAFKGTYAYGETPGGAAGAPYPSYAYPQQPAPFNAYGQYGAPPGQG